MNKLTIPALHALTELAAIEHAEHADGLAVKRGDYIVTYHAAREAAGKRAWRVENIAGDCEWFKSWPAVLFFIETPREWRAI